MADESLRKWLEDQGDTTTTSQSSSSTSSSNIVSSKDDMFGGIGKTDLMTAQNILEAGNVAQNNRWTDYSTLLGSDFGVVNTVTGKTESVGGIETPLKFVTDSLRSDLSTDALKFHSGDKEGNHLAALGYDLLGQIDSTRLNVDNTLTGMALAFSTFGQNPNNYTQNEFYHTQAGKWLAGSNAISQTKQGIKEEGEQGRTGFGKFMLGVTQQSFDQLADRILAAPIDAMTGGSFSTILMALRSGSSQFVESLDQQMNTNLNNGKNPFEDKMNVDMADIWARAIERGFTSWASENVFDASFAGGAGWADELAAGLKDGLQKVFKSKLITNVVYCGLAEAIEEAANNLADAGFDWVGMKIGLGDSLGWGWQKEDGSFDALGFAKDTGYAMATAFVSAALSGVARTFTTSVDQQKISYNQQQMDGYSAMPVNNLISNLSKPGKSAYNAWLKANPEATNQQKLEWLFEQADKNSSYYKDTFSKESFLKKYKDNFETIKKLNSENSEIVVKTTTDAVNKALRDKHTMDEALRQMEVALTEEEAQAAFSVETDGVMPAAEKAKSDFEAYSEQAAAEQEQRPATIANIREDIKLKGIEIPVEIQRMLQMYDDGKLTDAISIQVLKARLENLVKQAQTQRKTEPTPEERQTMIDEILGNDTPSKPAEKPEVSTPVQTTEQVAPAASAPTEVAEPTTSTPTESVAQEVPTKSADTRYVKSSIWNHTYKHYDLAITYKNTELRTGTGDDSDPHLIGQRLDVPIKMAKAIDELSFENSKTIDVDSEEFKELAKEFESLGPEYKIVEYTLKDGRKGVKFYNSELDTYYGAAITGGVVSGSNNEGLQLGQNVDSGTSGYVDEGWTAEDQADQSAQPIDRGTGETEELTEKIKEAQKQNSLDRRSLLNDKDGIITPFIDYIELGADTGILRWDSKELSESMKTVEKSGIKVIMDENTHTIGFVPIGGTEPAVFIKVPTVESLDKAAESYVAPEVSIPAGTATTTPVDKMYLLESEIDFKTLTDDQILEYLSTGKVKRVTETEKPAQTSYDHFLQEGSEESEEYIKAQKAKLQADLEKARPGTKLVDGVYHIAPVYGDTLKLTEDHPEILKIQIQQYQKLTGIGNLVNFQFDRCSGYVSEEAYGIEDGNLDTMAPAFFDPKTGIIHIAIGGKARTDSLLDNFEFMGKPRYSHGDAIHEVGHFLIVEHYGNTGIPSFMRAMESSETGNIIIDYLTKIHSNSNYSLLGEEFLCDLYSIKVLSNYGETGLNYAKELYSGNQVIMNFIKTMIDIKEIKTSSISEFVDGITKMLPNTYEIYNDSEFSEEELNNLFEAFEEGFRFAAPVKSDESAAAVEFSNAFIDEEDSIGEESDYVYEIVNDDNNDRKNDTYKGPEYLREHFEKFYSDMTYEEAVTLAEEDFKYTVDELKKKYDKPKQKDIIKNGIKIAEKKKAETLRFIAEIYGKKIRKKRRKSGDPDARYISKEERKENYKRHIAFMKEYISTNPDWSDGRKAYELERFNAECHYSETVQNLRNKIGELNNAIKTNKKLSEEERANLIKEIEKEKVALSNTIEEAMDAMYDLETKNPDIRRELCYSISEIENKSKLKMAMESLNEDEKEFVRRRIAFKAVGKTFPAHTDNEVNKAYQNIDLIPDILENFPAEDLDAVITVLNDLAKRKGIHLDFNMFAGSGNVEDYYRKLFTNMDDYNGDIETAVRHYVVEYGKVCKEFSKKIISNFKTVMKQVDNLKKVRSDQVAAYRQSLEDAAVTNNWKGVARAVGNVYTKNWLEKAPLSEIGKKAVQGEAYIDCNGITHDAEEVGKAFEMVTSAFNPEFNRNMYGITHDIYKGLTFNHGYNTPGEAVASYLNQDTKYIVPIVKLSKEGSFGFVYDLASRSFTIVPKNVVKELNYILTHWNASNKSEMSEKYLKLIGEGKQSFRAEITKAISGESADIKLTIGNTCATSDELGFGRDENGNNLTIDQQISEIRAAGNGNAMNIKYVRFDVDSAYYTEVMKTLTGNNEFGEVTYENTFDEMGRRTGNKRIVNTEITEEQAEKGILHNGVNVPGFGHMNFSAMTSGDAKEGRLRFVNDSSFQEIHYIYNQRGIMKGEDVNMSKFRGKAYEASKWLTHTGNDWTPTTPLKKANGEEVISVKECLVIKDFKKAVNSYSKLIGDCGHAIAKWNKNSGKFEFENEETWDFDFSDGCAWTSNYIGEEGYRQFRGAVGTGIKGIIQNFPLAETLVANGIYQFPDFNDNLVNLCELDENGKPVLGEDGKPIMIIKTIISDGSFKFAKFFDSNSEWQAQWEGLGMGFRYLQTWDSRSASLAATQDEEESVQRKYEQMNYEEEITEINSASGDALSEAQEFWLGMKSSGRKPDPISQLSRSMLHDDVNFTANLVKGELNNTMSAYDYIANRKNAIMANTTYGPNPSGLKAYAKILGGSFTPGIQRMVNRAIETQTRGNIIGHYSNEAKISRVLLPDIIGVMQEMVEIANEAIAKANGETYARKEVTGGLGKGEVAFADTDLTLGRDIYVSARFPLQSGLNAAEVKNKALDYSMLTIKLFDGEHPLSDFLVDEAVYTNINDNLCMRWDGDFDGDHVFFSREVAVIEALRKHNEWLEQQIELAEKDPKHPFNATINNKRITLDLRGGMSFDHISDKETNVFNRELPNELSIARGIRSALSAPAIPYFDSGIASILGTDIRNDGKIYTNAEKLKDILTFSIGSVVAIDSIKTGFFPPSLYEEMRKIAKKINPRYKMKDVERDSKIVDPINGVFMPKEQTPLVNEFRPEKNEAYNLNMHNTNMWSGQNIEANVSVPVDANGNPVDINKMKYGYFTETNLTDWEQGKMDVKDNEAMNRYDWVNRVNVVAPRGSALRGGLLGIYEFCSSMPYNKINSIGTTEMDHRITNEEARNSYYTREHKQNNLNPELDGKNTAIKSQVTELGIKYCHKHVNDFNSYIKNVIVDNLKESGVSTYTENDVSIPVDELCAESVFNMSLNDIMCRYIKEGARFDYREDIEPLTKMLRLRRSILSAGIYSTEEFNRYYSIITSINGPFNDTPVRNNKFKIYGREQISVPTLSEWLSKTTKTQNLSEQEVENLKVILGFYMQGAIKYNKPNKQCSALKDFDKSEHYKMFTYEIGTPVLRPAVKVKTSTGSRFDQPFDTRVYSQKDATAMNLICRALKETSGEYDWESMTRGTRNTDADNIFWSCLYNYVSGTIFGGTLDTRRFADLCGEAVHGLVNPDLQKSIYRFGVRAQPQTNVKVDPETGRRMEDSKIPPTRDTHDYAENKATNAVLRKLGNYFQYNYSMRSFGLVESMHSEDADVEIETEFKNIIKDKKAWDDAIKNGYDFFNFLSADPSITEYFIDQKLMDADQAVNYYNDYLSRIRKSMEVAGIWRTEVGSAEDATGLALIAKYNAEAGTINEQVEAKRAELDKAIMEGYNLSEINNLRRQLEVLEQKLSGNRVVRFAAPRKTKISRSTWTQAIGTIESNVFKDERSGAISHINVIKRNGDVEFPFDNTNGGEKINYKIVQTIAAVQEFVQEPTLENANYISYLLDGAKESLATRGGVSIVDSNIVNAAKEVSRCCAILTRFGDMYRNPVGITPKAKEKAMLLANKHLTNAINTYWATMFRLQNDIFTQRQIVDDLEGRINEMESWSELKKASYMGRLNSTDAVHMFDELYRGSSMGEEIMKKFRVNYAKWVSKSGARKKQLDTLFNEHKYSNEIMKAYLYTCRPIFESQKKYDEDFKFSKYDEAVEAFKSIPGAEEFVNEFNEIMLDYVSSANEISMAITGSAIDFEEDQFFFPVSASMFLFDRATNEAFKPPKGTDYMNIASYGQYLSGEGKLDTSNLIGRVKNFAENITMFECMLPTVADIEGTLNKDILEDTRSLTGRSNLNGLIKKAFSGEARMFGNWVLDMHGDSSRQRTENFFTRSMKEYQSAVLGMNIGSGLKQTISFENMTQFCDDSIMAKYRPKIIFSFGWSAEKIASEIEKLPEVYRNYLYNKLYQQDNEINVNSDTLIGRVGEKLSSVKLIQNLINFNAHEDLVTNVICCQMANEQLIKNLGREGTEGEHLSWLAESVCAANPQFNQVYRSELQRSNSDFLRSLGMFKTPAIQNFSNFLAAKQRMKDNPNAETRKEYRRCLEAQLKTAGSMAIVSVLMSLIKRPDKFKEKDEEGEYVFSWEKFIKQLGLQYVSGGSSLFSPMFGSLVSSGVNKLFGDGQWYDMEFSGGLTIINGLAESLVDLIGDATSGKPVINDIRNMAVSIAQARGIPLEQVLSILNGVTMHTLNAMGMNEANKKSITALLDYMISQEKKEKVNKNEFIEKYGISSEQYDEWAKAYGDNFKDYVNDWTDLTTKSRNEYGSFTAYADNRESKKEITSSRAEELDLESFKDTFESEADYKSFYNRMTSDSGYEMAKKFGGADTYQMFLDKFDTNDNGEVSQEEFARHFLDGYTEADAEVFKTLYGENANLENKIGTVQRADEKLAVKKAIFGTNSDEEAEELWSSLFKKMDAANDSNGYLSKKDVAAAKKLYPEYADYFDLYYIVQNGYEKGKRTKSYQSVYDMFFSD